MNSLSDKLSEILCTAPTLIDPEDDIYEETSAKVVENNFDVEELNEEVINKKVCRKNIQLDELDKRYEGVKSSRKNLNSDLSTSEDELSDKEEVDELDSDTSDELSDESNENKTTSDENEEISKISLSNEKKVEPANDNINFRHLQNISSNIKKGNCVNNQLTIWENLIEMRIQLQKCLLTANKMPQKDYFHKVKQFGGSEMDKKINMSKKCVSKVLDKLLTLQSVLLKLHPETKNLKCHNIEDKSKDIDDEEIPSETESSANESDNENVKRPSDNVKEGPLSKKRKTLSDYESILQNTHELYKPYRNSIIQNWNEKTRVSVAKNNINVNSVVNQIEFILKDKDKCIKRTQLKRSNYEIIGQKRKVDVNDSDKQLETSGSEYNKEIFDDDDFYHQLLRELIECKSAGVTDPVQLSRQWIELQSVRSKMKRKIDTKATKGRKIRYAVHSKLVNFMAPIPDSKWTDEAKTELFNSLFGNKSFIKVK